MPLSFLSNPYSMYSLVFGSALALYGLDWSFLYPPLSTSLLVFLAATFLLAAMLYILTRHITGAPFCTSLHPLNHKKHIAALGVFVLANIAYTKNIPLYESMFSDGYRAKEYDVMPLFFPLMVAYSYVMGLRFFVRFLTNRSSCELLNVALCTIPPLLFVQRGLVFSQITTCLLLSACKATRLSLLGAALTAVLIVLLMLGFGELGTLRDSGGAYYRPITEIAGASDSFYATGISDNIFYAWVYLTSPLANLQMNTGTNISQLGSGFTGFVDFATAEILPDSISKRLVDLDLLVASYFDIRIVETLNVGTMYSRAYSYFGWSGMMVLAAYFFAFNFLYLWFLGRKTSPLSEYRTIGIAILTNLALMMVFDNMLSNTARVAPLLVLAAFIQADPKR